MTSADPRIPASIQTLWTTLDKEVVWLHGRWIIYRQLYGTTPERVDILNKSAGSFFNIFQDVLLHDVQLALSKLGDTAGSGTRTNLTLKALLKGLESAGEQAVASKLKPCVQKFEAACVKVRHRRNKWIAHFDLTTMLNSDVSPRVGPSRAEIESALEALRDAMNSVSLHYTDTHIGYEHFSMIADGEALLQILMRGLRYKELVDDNTIPRDDFRKRFGRGA